jgi:glycosyltransferase involved in cell wall biosynthesis
MKDISQPLVTIGIPFYNAEDYLKFAILSVINQTCDNWELILINDGSTDKSIEIAMSFQDKRISVIDDGLNKGLIFRLNQLIKLSNGIYFARMDADDIMLPDRIEKQIFCLMNNEKIDVLGTLAYSIDEKNKIIGRRGKVIQSPSFKRVIEENIFIHPSVTGKKTWFLENLYDSSMERMEDMELWIRTFNFSTFRVLDEPLIYYREVGINQTKKFLQTSKGLRNLYKRLHSNKKINLMFNIKLILKTYFKDLVYIVSSFMDFDSFLLKNRSVKLKSSELQIAKENLLTALNE